MPLRSTFFSVVPAATPFSADCLQRRGDRVVGDGQLAPGAVEHRGVERLAAGGLQAGVDRGLRRRRRRPWPPATAATWPRSSAATVSGYFFEELGAHDQVRGDELAVRPQVLLVDQHVAAALEHQPRGVGLGHPGAVELAALEQVEDVGCWPSARS